MSSETRTKCCLRLDCLQEMMREATGIRTRFKKKKKPSNVFVETEKRKREGSASSTVFIIRFTALFLPPLFLLKRQQPHYLTKHGRIGSRGG